MNQFVELMERLMRINAVWIVSSLLWLTLGSVSSKKVLMNAFALLSTILYVAKMERPMRTSVDCNVPMLTSPTTANVVQNRTLMTVYVLTPTMIPYVQLMERLLTMSAF